LPAATRIGTKRGKRGVSTVAVGAERGGVERRRFAAHQLGEQASGARRGLETGHLVAGGEPDVRESAAGAADHRHAVGRARAKAPPELVRRQRVGERDHAARGAHDRFDTPTGDREVLVDHQLERARDAQRIGVRIERQLALGEHQRASRVPRAARHDERIALGAEHRQAQAEPGAEALRPGTGRHHHLVAGEISRGGEQPSRAAAGELHVVDLGRLDQLRAGARASAASARTARCGSQWASRG
jgi:hypothetical protein